MLKLLACEHHQTQNKRDYQEDTIAYSEATQVFIVCDGMGGHSGGAAASKAAATAIVESNVFPARNLNDQFFSNLAQSVQLEMNKQKIEGGTTIAGFTYNDKQAAVFWAGDSRVYFVNAETKEVKLLTEDHNHFQQLVLQGLADKDAMDPHFNRSKCSLLNSFGFMDYAKHADLSFRTTKFQDIKDFWIIIASDGLNENLSHTATEQVIAQFFDNPVALTEAAIGSGSTDNISVMCLHFQTE